MDILLSPWMGLLALGTFAISYTIRKFLEALVPMFRTDTPLTVWQRVWEEALLPSLPIFIGIGLAVLVTHYPFPVELKDRGSRAIYGAVCGFFCSWAYRIAKAFISRKFAVDLDAPVDVSLEVKKP